MKDKRPIPGMDRRFIQKNKLYLAQLMAAQELCNARDEAMSFAAGKTQSLDLFSKIINGILVKSGQLPLSLDMAKALVADTAELNGIIVIIDTAIIDCFKNATGLNKVENGPSQENNSLSD